MGSSASKPVAVIPPAFDEKQSVTKVAASLSALSIAAPTSSDGSLTLSNVSSWENDISSDSKAQLARTVLVQTDIREVLVSRQSRVATTHIFNHEIDFKTGPVTNQKSSGRCWLFATTNVLRYDIMKKLKLKEFQLSQVTT
jgi:bleomycin hydrolase